MWGSAYTWCFVCHICVGCGSGRPTNMSWISSCLIFQTKARWLQFNWSRSYSLFCCGIWDTVTGHQITTGGSCLWFQSDCCGHWWRQEPGKTSETQHWMAPKLCPHITQPLQATHSACALFWWLMQDACRAGSKGSSCSWNGNRSIYIKHIH